MIISRPLLILWKDKKSMMWPECFLHFFFSWKECHCMLFLTPENDFAGKDQKISLEEIRETTANM